jgi:hypothetical protein
MSFETGEDRKYVIFETLNGSVSRADLFETIRAASE